MLGRVDVGRTQIRRQQVMPAEDVERQEAVPVIVAVEKAVDLVAVNPVVGGVEVEDQFLRRLFVRGDEDFDENFGDVGQRPPGDAVLQPAQRRRRSQRLIRIDAAFGDQLHQRIVAQGLMVVAILVAQRDGEDPLAEHRALLMCDQQLIPRIRNDGVELVDQAELAIHFAKQQSAGIRGDRSPVKISHDLTTRQTGKNDGLGVTLCHVTALPPCVYRCVATADSTGSKAVALCADQR